MHKCVSTGATQQVRCIFLFVGPETGSGHETPSWKKNIIIKKGIGCCAHCARRTCFDRAAKTSQRRVDSGVMVCVLWGGGGLPATRHTDLCGDVIPRNDTQQLLLDTRLCPHTSTPSADDDRRDVDSLLEAQGAELGKWRRRRVSREEAEWCWL